MMRFAVAPREAAFAVATFVALIAAFAVLGLIAGWPNRESGWPLLVVVALLLAALPIAPRLLDQLQAGRASVTLPGGFSLDFGGAVVETRAPRLPDNLVAPGVALQDTSQEELDRVAEAAGAQPVIVADLKDGRAWYLTRLFALAATGVVLGSPKAIVLVGRDGGRDLRPGGWIRPRDLVTALTRREPGYAAHWAHARRYLEHLRLDAELRSLPLPPGLPQLAIYQDHFNRTGDRTILRIIVNQMRTPDTPPPGGFARDLPVLEDDADPPWIELAELKQRLAPWLVRRAVELTLPERDQVQAILEAEDDIVLALRDGAYDGIIDVARAERRIVAQLAAQAGS